jgi:hypothetical protein
MKASKILLVSLISFLVSSLFYFPVKTQTVNGEVSVEIVGRNVIFYGESVNIKSICNLSEVLVEIYNPNDVLVYRKYQTANTTFAYAPSQVYGKYTVKAYAGDAVAETWFWLQDTTNLNVFSANEKSWSLKDINFKVYPLLEAEKVTTYVLEAALNGETLRIEWLSEVFSKLKPTTVTVETNNAGLMRIKTYSGKNKIDSWIMDTFFGVKIRVNGTLEKATTFKWNLLQTESNILWSMESARIPCGKSNLIFDWSDMASRSVGCTYTLDKTASKLDVYLQTYFDVDPTIFSDGFESGDFSAWTSTSGTPTIVTSPVHHGTYAARFDASAEYITKTFTAVNLIYVRVYFQSANYPGSNTDDRFTVFRVGTTGGTYPHFIQWRRDSYGNVCWRVSPVGGATRNIYNPAPTLNTWYCVEIMCKIGTTDGEARTYINGVEVDAQTGLNNAGGGSIDKVQVGLTSVVGTVPTTTEDCVVVADTYIGPEAEGPQEINLSFSETVAVTDSFSQLQAQIWRLSETATATDTLNFWVERTYAFAESFVETLQPFEFMQFNVEFKLEFLPLIETVSPYTFVSGRTYVYHPFVPWYYNPYNVILMSALLVVSCYLIYKGFK